jgi:hypothetical protein
VQRAQWLSRVNTAINSVCGSINSQIIFSNWETNRLGSRTLLIVRKSSFGSPFLRCATWCKIYLFAGGGEIDQRSGEKYDPTTNTWTEIPSMRTPRQDHATAIIDDKIFAIGGINGSSRTRRVECFDKRTNEWFVYWLLQDIIMNCNFWITIKWNTFIHEDHSLMECYHVVSYKLTDSSEVLTASIIRSMSRQSKKCVWDWDVAVRLWRQYFGQVHI